MRKNYYLNDSASICANEKCVTVQGDVAKFVNGLAMVTAIAVAAITIAKVLK